MTPRTTTASLVLLLAALLAAPAYSQPVGIGFTLGEPTGPNFKFWRDQDEALVLGFGVSFDRDTSFQAHADYLLHFFQPGRALLVPGLSFYTGLGCRLNGPQDHHVEFGIRFPFGVNWQAPGKAIELFGELVPLFTVAPDARADFNAAIGIRFYGR